MTVVFKRPEFNASGDDIRESLLELNFEIVNVQQFRRDRSGAKMPIWEVELPKFEVKMFFEPKSLSHIKIKVEG